MKRDLMSLPLDPIKARARTRSVWRTMRARCSNPKHISFSRYGALGISVCSRWGDFDNFLADMGLAPAGLTLERTDGMLGYSPENCIWVTPKQQARNRSNNVSVEYKGESKPISEWAELFGLEVGTLWRRLKTGVSIEIALTRPLCRGKPMFGKQKPRRATT